MLVLLGIGLLAGIVTAISPCVLPVLPILLAGGASGRKPLQVIAGLVASFTVFTLFATWLLDKLGLPDDLLRNLAIALLFLLAAILLVPRLAVVVERPLAGFSRFRPHGGSFLFGATLGLVFVPHARLPTRRDRLSRRRPPRQAHRRAGGRAQRPRLPRPELLDPPRYALGV